MSLIHSFSQKIFSFLPIKFVAGKLSRAFMLAILLAGIFSGPRPLHAAWLVQGGAELFIPFKTTITQNNEQTIINNHKAGGFFGLVGYRFLYGLDVTAEYVFLQYRADVPSGDALGIDPARNFYVANHLALANIGYRFGREWGLKNFGLYIGSGLGAWITNGRVGGYNYGSTHVVIPFKFGVDYQINEIFALGLYARYYLPIGKSGQINDTTVSMSSLGGVSAGLSLGLNF